MRITKYGLMIEQQQYMLVKESAVNYAADELDTAAKICKMFNDLYKLNQLAEEYVYMAALACKGKVLGVFEVSHGTGNSSFLRPREVFMRLLLAGASSYVVIHNHPSGDCTPSKVDIDITRVLKEAGNMMGIPLIDHIIAGGSDHYSFYKHGLLD